MNSDNDVYSPEFESNLDEFFAGWSVNEGAGWRSAEARRAKWRHDPQSSAQWRAAMVAKQAEREQLGAFEETIS
jgi:hypothetical protein